ncbi:Beta-lactamase-like [Syntrophomonas zehnderi OL-4]|uniref:Beta-lactamase-like n=1 Tax=Syntrophomonas zehnderi OL-4 TaxID=690567 RepID=A0A0E3W3Q5_9FIRM|nr:MBL fold metallo-hydrolase [Syntrophomonas zehnderi]CFX98325.1 Beta-lactamase-like [Syntrophomonas zehnderi OL-4]
MIIDKIGHIKDNLYCLGYEECPIYLWDGAKPAIFDAGVTCAGKVYAESIRSILKERQPAVLFLTHVHWDHCGAAAYLKKAFPEMQIAATSIAESILQRPNALALISKLNADSLDRMSLMPGFDRVQMNTEPFAPFEIDIKLQDGQVFDLGDGTKLKVLATPGHTKDHHSFYLPAEKILFAGEAAGVYYSPEVVTTEFVYNYDAYLSSLQRLAALPSDIFCQGHYSILAGREEIKGFLEKSINATIGFKKRVLELLKEENGSIEKVISRAKAEYYDPFPALKQPEDPYLLNLKAKVAHLAAQA